jgi:CO/xanthine dehydrogenase FAD-binding subunit
VSAGDFITGLFETELAQGEVLAEIRVPKTGAR